MSTLQREAGSMLKVLADGLFAREEDSDGYAQSPQTTQWIKPLQHSNHFTPYPPPSAERRGEDWIHFWMIGSIFLDRDPTLFGSVLTYLRAGKVVAPGASRSGPLQRELQYYGLTSAGVASTRLFVLLFGILGPMDG